MNSAQAQRPFAVVAPALPAPSFLERISLATLVSPMSRQEFVSCYWEQKPLVLHRHDSGYYGDLFTLQDFDESIIRGPSYVKTAEATAKKQTRHHGAGAQSLERVLADMRQGATLILDAVHQRDPKLNLLCRALAKESGHTFQTNLYLTPPNGKGFLPHWDNHDVFVLQVLGSKRWTLETARRAFPDKDENIADEDRDVRGATSSFTLEQGDMLYIPRGYVHAAECGPECSLHITLGVGANTWRDFLFAVVKAATLRDETLRRALPWGFLNGNGAAIAHHARNALLAAADSGFLGEVADQFGDELVKYFPLDVSGQVSGFYQPDALKLDDVVGARPGTVYTTRQRQDNIVVNIGFRSVAFPVWLRGMLEFALNQREFAIADLPGDFAGEEKLVFVERLLQEGLVIRKKD